MVQCHSSCVRHGSASVQDCVCVSLFDMCRTDGWCDETHLELSILLFAHGHLAGCSQAVVAT